MSTASNPWPPDPNDLSPEAPEAPEPAEENYVSEFLSEKSPEFNAVREAAAAARQAQAPSATAGAARPAVAKAPHPSARPLPWMWLVGFASLAGIVALSAWAFDSRQAANAAAAEAAAQGSATIVSRPAGADVFINGQRRGLTPLQLSLPVGSYELELRNGGATRSLALTIDAATAVREVVDLAPAPVSGRIEVTSDMAGARVSLNGVVRGLTPLVVTDVEAGEHRLAITRGETTVHRTVTVEPGATATVMASIVPTGATGGWLTFDVPFEMQVIENGLVLGTTGADRLMVPAGRHELILVAAPYGFSTAASAIVGAGRTERVQVTLPDGQLSINAHPWADVWLDGQPLGSTPLANITVPIGDHEVILRHPELGQRQQLVRVAANTPARVGIDLSR